METKMLNNDQYDVIFVQEIQKRHDWPVIYGVGPFKSELEGRVAIQYIGLSIVTGRMMVPKPEYDSLPADIQAKLGAPLRALDDR